jgi:uncharacterized protein (TIGR02265 family)
MGMTNAVLELVGDHCDLRERLGAVRPSAQIRGMYLRSVQGALERAGRGIEYRALCGTPRFSALRFYPLGEYLTHLAAGGALLKGPERVHEGMFELSRSNAAIVADSLVGRTLLRALARDPQRILRQAIAAQRQTARGSAQWSLSFPGPREAVMEFKDEMIWIESGLLGAARGTMEAAGIDAKIRCELTNAYNGSHCFSW